MLKVVSCAFIEQRMQHPPYVPIPIKFPRKIRILLVHVSLIILLSSASSYWPVSHITMISPPQTPANHHQPLKHDMRCVCGVLIHCVRCVCGLREQMSGQTRRERKRDLKKKKSQVSSGVDFTWRIKTERHAKWPNYCNEKQSWHWTVIACD